MALGKSQKEAAFGGREGPGVFCCRVFRFLFYFFVVFYIVNLSNNRVYIRNM